jgi:hypothetical protein
MNQEGQNRTVCWPTSADTDKASWATYDVNLDSWTKEYLGENQNPLKMNQNPIVQQIQFWFHLCR